MVDFLCVGLVWAMRNVKQIRNEKFLPTVGFQPTSFRFEGKGLIKWTTGADGIHHLIEGKSKCYTCAMLYNFNMQ